MSHRTGKTLVSLVGCLLFSSHSHAWEYVLNPALTCSFFRQMDKAEFEAITVDAQGSLIACGPITYENPPAPVHVAKVSSSAGAEAWTFNVGGAPNLRALSFCNSVSAGAENQLFLAASTAERDYTVRNFTVAKLLPDGHAAWRFSRGKPRGGDFSFSTANIAVPDPAGDVIATGRIELDEYGSVIIKLSGIDGAEIWHRDASPLARIVVDQTGNIVMAGSEAPTITKIAGFDGAELWRYERDATSPGIQAMLLDDAGNPIAADGGVISKIESFTGVPVWSVPKPSSTLLKGRPDEVLGVSFPEVVVLSIESGQVLGQFGLEHQPADVCSHFAVDGQADLFASCGNHELVKWSGENGTMLWRRSTSGSAFVIDALGDVSVAGSQSLYHHDDDCVEIDYLDYSGVIQKYWGKTGGDYPPSPGDRLRYLGDLVRTLSLGLGLENSLIAKLTRAAGVLEDGNPANDSRAANFLTAFVNEVRALEGKGIPSDVVENLLSEAKTTTQAIALK